MSITEKDIFNSIFFPEKLSDELKDFIESNAGFKELREFYMQLKLDLNSEILSPDKKFISEKINVYTPDPEIIHLFAVELKSNKKHREGRLAAASVNLDPQLTTVTFIDRDKEYLVKVLNYGNNTKIFVFSTNNNEVKNFDVIIEPEHLIYHMENNSEPLKINRSIDPSKISLKFR